MRHNSQTIEAPTDHVDESFTVESDMPLGVGEFAGETPADSLGGSGRRSRLSGGTLLLGAVIVIAGLGLFSMRALTRVSVASGGGSDVELTIEKFLRAVKGGSDATAQAPTGALVARNENVLQVLEEEYTERQVPLENVQFNPFIIFSEIVPPPPTIIASSDGGKAELERLREERRAQIELATSDLQLKSVIHGSDPLANVSGKIVRAGDSIALEDQDIELTVVSVTATSVVLETADPTFDLIFRTTLHLKRN